MLIKQKLKPYSYQQFLFRRIFSQAHNVSAGYENQKIP